MHAGCICWALAKQCAGLLQFSADAGDGCRGIGYLLIEGCRTGFGSLLSQEIAVMDSHTKNSPDTPRAEDMLTPKEFAKAHKVSLSWLAKARKRGDGPPFVRFGRSVRYFPLRKPE